MRKPIPIAIEAHLQEKGLLSTLTQALVRQRSRIQIPAKAYPASNEDLKEILTMFKVNYQLKARRKSNFRLIFELSSIIAFHDYSIINLICITSKKEKVN
jgi:hypothetical protein